MPVNMQERLAAANAVHHAANEGPDGPLPGQYQLQLRRAKFAESESDGKFRIRWTFVVIGGEYDGEEVSDVSAVESPKKAPLRMAKERCRRLDVEPPVDVWGYAEVCPLLTQRAPIVTAQVTHSGNYANIRVLELLMAVGAPSAPAAPAAAPVPAASAVSLPVAAPIPQAAAPAALAPAVPASALAVPAVPGEVVIGDTVRYIDPESGQAYDGLADKINAGVTTVVLDADRQFDAPTESLTVLTKAAPAALGAPAMPTIPAPAAAPTADDVLRGKLLVIAKSFALQANDLSSTEELTATLGESEWVEGGEDGLSATEATTLRSVGIPVAVAAHAVPAPTPPPPPPPAPAPAPAAKPKAAKKKAKKKAAKRKKRA